MLLSEFNPLPPARLSLPRPPYADAPTTAGVASVHVPAAPLSVPLQDYRQDRCVTTVRQCPDVINPVGV